MSSALNIMSKFYFALFISAFVTAGRMGLGSSLVDAGSKWYFIAIEFVLMSLGSALIFFLIFNLLRRLLDKPTSSSKN